MPGGWQLEDEPDLTPDAAIDDQQWWITMRADAQQSRDQAKAAGQDTLDFDELIRELDEEITRSGVRGNVAPGRPARRHRSTRRRQDAPDLPKRRSARAPWGRRTPRRTARRSAPSLFITLTCPSYGRVDHRGVPVDPARYAYDQAARDALTFAALFDRFIQNLRRYLGTEVQYFAAVEPQRRLAPHVHIALRGTIARSELRRVLAATYHQVWWPGGGLAWTGSGCMICGTVRDVAACEGRSGSGHYGGARACGDRRHDEHLRACFAGAAPGGGGRHG